MRPHMFAAAMAVAVTLSLGGCAPGYDAVTRDSLREHVVAVAEASAAGDWPAALAGLDVMAEELADARAEGKVSEERFVSVVLAMELVRKDLASEIAAADAAEQQRLLEEQARLEEQIAQLQDQQNQGNDDDKGKGNKDEDNNDEGDEDKGGDDGKNGGEGKSE